MKKFNSKKATPFIVALIAFVVFGCLYCSPLLEGKVLQAGDLTNYQGASNEIREYTKSEGRQMWWTNSMFGGMPSYQISGQTPANRLRGKMENVSHLGFTGNKAAIGIVIAYLIGFFLMLICFDVNPWVSMIGAFALTLSTYFMLIIPAGHITKANAICCLAPMIGGFYAVYRKKYWLGAPLLLFYGTIGLTLHAQMTYYMFLLIGLMFIAELAGSAMHGTWKEFGKSTAVIAVSLLIVFGTKLSWWQMNQGYLKETMRGGHSELTQQVEEDSQPVGLDFDYATAWSYGKAETMTLMVPDFMGGCSGYDLGKDSQLEKSLKGMGVPSSQARAFCQGAPTYWGEKTFTSGPVYVGAIVCFLFILGLLIVKGPYKWALAIATLFSITLAWGHNFEWLSKLFFYHFPLYNKFRTVESILVVAEVAMPLLGFLAVKQLFESEDQSKYRKPILIAAGISAVICLITAVSAGFMDVTSSFDQQWKPGVGQQIYDVILEQRRSLVSASAMRSLAFVIVGAAITMLLCFTKNRKNGKTLFIVFMGVAILADMVPINRKYFGRQNFVTAKQNAQAFAMQDWENEILKDTSLDYRVLNVAANTFNDARTSYRLKSIGGYSAAKLRRYQDIIDAHISNNNMSVINMLNTRYFVTDNYQVIQNPDAMGNAWFVDRLHYVDTPVQESEALNHIDVRTMAVADSKFSDILDIERSAPDSTAYITLDKYVPDRLEYTSFSSCDKIAVFSEIYYPEGWHLYVDGEEHQIGRVNYILRAAVLPAGNHKIVMEFVPEALKTTDRLCIALVILTILLAIGLPAFHFVRSLR